MPTPNTPPSPSYIWQHSTWPRLTFDAAALAQANVVQRDLWVQEALATAALEGEPLNLESLRSSVAHRLQLADAPGSDGSVDGLVQVMQDALVNHSAALDLDRLCRWQSALFPGGTSGITRIAVGRVRTRACIASQAVVRDATDKASSGCGQRSAISPPTRAGCWSACWMPGMWARAVASWAG